MTTSPRKSSIRRKQSLASASKVPPKDRKHPRCTKCPDRPLRAECEHTAAGRKFLNKQKATLLLVAGQIPETGSPLVREGQPSVDLFGSQEKESQATTPTNGAFALPAVPVSPHFQIDPNLESDTPDTPTPASRSARETSNTNTDTPATGQATPVTEAPTPRSKQSAKRATASDPFNGHVSGVQRGAEEFKLFRHHQRPQAVGSTAEATKHFQKDVHALIERCDDLAAKTNCWLFIGVQHPNAKAQAIHYASPRLIKDSPDQTGDVATSFLGLISTVQQLRRSDTIELQQRLKDANDEKTKIQEQLEESRKEEERKSELLLKYQQQYGLIF